MSYLANPRHYARDEFRMFVDGLAWNKGWRPKFPTLHNTGVPSLSQWLSYGATTKERWGAGLNRYYQGLAGTPAPISSAVLTISGFYATWRRTAFPFRAGTGSRSA